MAQTEDIIDLFKTLCRYHSCKSTTEYYDQKQLFRKVFSILLKRSSANNPCLYQKNSLQFSDEDFVHSEIFNLQLSSNTHKAQKLAALIQFLKDEQGNLSDDIASCLKFLLCLSKCTPIEKCKEVFKYDVDSFEPNMNNGCTSIFSFQYKSYPRSLFEESHYPSLESSEYSLKQFETEPQTTCGSTCLHKNFFNQMATSVAYGCFGAFRTLPQRKNLNVILELPLLSESNLERSTFYTFNREEKNKITVENDHSEDEGFVDPKMDDKPESCDGTEVWEKVSGWQPKNFLSWEYQDSSYANEKVYLSQSGPESAGVICLSHQQNLHFLDPTLQPSAVKTLNVDKLLTDCTHLLLAVESETFLYDKSTKSFVMQSEVQIPGLTPECIQHLLIDLMKCGTYCKRLEMFSTSTGFNQGGRLVANFKEGLRQYLQYYRGAVLYIAQNHGHSLLQLHLFISNLINQMRYVSEMCFLGDHHKNKKVPLDLKLLDYLYGQCLEQWGGENYMVLLFLLKITSAPYVRFLQDWLFEGICDDRFGDFNVKVNNQYVSARNELFWSKAFTPVNANWVSPFLKESSTVVLCGKALNLLRICCPEHCLFNGQQHRPMISFSLSKRKLHKITKLNKGYLENMMHVLELQQCIRKACEEKRKIEEFKLLLEARHAAATQYRRQRELKKEQYQEKKMKQLLYHDNLTQQIKEQRDLAKAANDKEESPEDLSHIELQVTDEIVDHYTKLMDDANRQQQKFEWQAKRFELHEKRQKFFKDEGERLLCDVQNAVENGGSIDENLLEPVKDSSFELEDTPAHNENIFYVNNFITESKNSSIDDCVNKWEIVERLEDQPRVLNGDVAETININSSNIASTISPESRLITECKDVARGETKNVNEELNEDLDAEARFGGTSNDEDGSIVSSEETSIPSKVKPYEVDCTALTSIPSQDFVKHIPKASELFGYFRDEQDEDFLAQTPLPVLMSRSFYPTVHAQAKLVNKAVLDYFLHDLHIVDHFNALRNYFFFQDGEFGEALSQLLFNKMHIGQKGSSDLFSPFMLSSILNEALAASITGENKYSANLTFALGSRTGSRTCSDFEMLDSLELLYKVDWPLNLIITDGSMESYNTVWRFLLYIKHLLWTLMNTWHCMKQSEQFFNAPTAWQYRRLQIYRHEMQHFVRAIQNFIASEMLQIAWVEFEATVTQKVATVDELINAHNEYLKTTCRRCLLTKEAKPVMKFVQFLFDMVFKFHLQISNLPLTWNTDKKAFERLCKIYDDFKECSKKLMMVLKSSVSIRPQQEISDFLVMLDLSNRYNAVVPKRM